MIFYLDIEIASPKADWSLAHCVAQASALEVEEVHPGAAATQNRRDHRCGLALRG